jgi:hypothetical protein
LCSHLFAWDGEDLKELDGMAWRGEMDLGNHDTLLA